MIAVKLTHKESDMAGGLTEAEMTVQEATAHCAVSTSEVDYFFFLTLVLVLICSKSLQ